MDRVKWGHEQFDYCMCEAFPYLYQRQNCSYFFNCFDIRSGWYNLIWELSENLNKLITFIQNEDKKKYQAYQVSSRYGRLYYYSYNRTPEMNKVIQFAESASTQICENCSHLGQFYPLKKGITLCPNCFKLEKEKQQRRREYYG